MCRPQRDRQIGQHHERHERPAARHHGQHQHRPADVGHDARGHAQARLAATEKHEKGVEQNIILATPTTLIALLRTVALSWQQQQVTENAAQIWKEGSLLFDRLKTFSEHMHKIRDGLQKATQSYNNALSSWESRVLPCATRLKDLGGPQHERELPEIEHVDTYLREPNE